MEAIREDEVTGEVARGLRQSLRMKQGDFWGEVGVRKKTGSAYERGSWEIPAPVRKLVFLRYVAGVPINGNPDTLHQIGRFASAHERALGHLEDAAETASRALDAINDAATGLNHV